MATLGLVPGVRAEGIDWTTDMSALLGLTMAGVKVIEGCMAACA